MGRCASCMMRLYSSGWVDARTSACQGPILAATTTISSGKTIRMPKTAIRMPQVRKARCHSGRMSFSLFAFTMALSKDSEISSTASTQQMKKMEAMPDRLPVDCQPSQAPRIRPKAVTTKAQRK